MHHWVFCPFGFLFLLLVIGFFVSNGILWRRRRWRANGGSYSNTPELILDKRLASGEISIDEYKKLKEVLKYGRK